MNVFEIGIAKLEEEYELSIDVRRRAKIVEALERFRRAAARAEMRMAEDITPSTESHQCHL